MGGTSSLFNTQRQVVSSFGVALLATVVSLTMNASGAAGLATPAGLLAFHNAAAVAALLAGAGAVFALQLRDARLGSSQSSNAATQVA